MAEKIKFTKKLSTKLSLIIFIIVFVIFACMISVIVRNVKSLNFTTTYSMVQNISAGRADEISNWIEIYKNDLRVYTEAEINKTGDEQAVIEWLQNNQQLRNSAYDYMFFCGKDGTTYRDTGLVGSKGGILERDYYKAVMIAKQDVFVGEMVLSKTSNQYVIPIARAAKDADGNIFGFYVGMLGFKTLSDKITSFTVGETGYAFLLDKAGKIIAHPDNDYVMNTVEDFPEIKPFVNIKNPIQDSLVVNGKKSHLFASPVNGLDWTVVFLLTEEEILQSMTTSQNIMIAFALFIEIVIFITFILMIRFIVKRINKVNELIDELSTGDADLTIQLETKKDERTPKFLLRPAGHRAWGEARTAHALSPDSCPGSGMCRILAGHQPHGVVPRDGLHRQRDGCRTLQHGHRTAHRPRLTGPPSPGRTGQGRGRRGRARHLHRRRPRGGTRIYTLYNIGASGPQSSSRTKWGYAGSPSVGA